MELIYLKIAFYFKKNNKKVVCMLDDQWYGTFKQQLAKKISDKTFDEGTTKNITEGVAYDLWQTMDNAVTALEPGVKEQTLKQSKLHQLAKGLNAKSKEKIRIPILGINIPASPVQSGQDLVGRTLQGVSDVTGKVPTGVPKGGAILSGMGVPKALSGGDQQQSEPIPDTMTSQTMPNQAPNVNPELQKVVASLKILDPKNAEMYDSLMPATTGGGSDAGLTEPQRVLREKNRTALRAVDELEGELLNPDGTINQSKVTLSSLPGSPGSRLYRSNWGSIIDAIGSNRTGAAYTSDQRKDYKHLLPVFGDSEETIREKIKNIRAELQGYAGQ
jgi:hypothetical protein